MQVGAKVERGAEQERPRLGNGAARVAVQHARIGLLGHVGGVVRVAELASKESQQIFVVLLHSDIPPR
ncbi:hypothetical protein D3C86_1936870 [compost metagenome]